jgi:hypothetical protein
MFGGGWSLPLTARLRFEFQTRKGRADGFFLVIIWGPGFF